MCKILFHFCETVRAMRENIRKVHVKAAVSLKKLKDLPPVTAKTLRKRTMKRHLFQVCDSANFENLDTSTRSGFFFGESNYIYALVSISHCMSLMNPSKK